MRKQPENRMEIHSGFAPEHLAADEVREEVKEAAKKASEAVPEQESEKPG